MRVRRLYASSLPFVAAACLAAGCATSGRAPDGFLPSRKMLPQSTRGAWALVTLTGSGERLEGELLTLDASAARLLTKSGVSHLPLGRIAELRLLTHRTNATATRSTSPVL